MSTRQKAAYPAPDVLIAIMTDQRDLRIAQQDHWYRIPVKSAPRNLAFFRWIAFYFTAAFGQNRWQIRYLAPINRTDQRTRRELLPAESNHARADVPYYQLHLGDSDELHQPIQSPRGRRLAFIPTTLAKLLAAEQFNDLFHDSPLEDRLWTALRRSHIAVERQHQVDIANQSYFLDFAVLCERGNLDVECDGDSWHLGSESAARDNARDNDLVSHGWQILRFGSRQLAESAIPLAVDRIHRSVDRLGGPSSPTGVTRAVGSSGDFVEQLRLW